MAKRVVEIEREHGDRSWTYITRYRRAEAARLAYEQQLEDRRSGEDLKQAAELERKKQEMQEHKKFEQLQRQAWEYRIRISNLIYLCQRYGLDRLPEVKAIACFENGQLPATVGELESWINMVSALLKAGQEQVEYLRKEEEKKREQQARAERYEEFLDSFEHWDEFLHRHEDSRRSDLCQMKNGKKKSGARKGPDPDHRREWRRMFRRHHAN